MVGSLSQLAKADGYLVSLVPPESYLDPMTGPAYDRSLLWAYPEFHPEFKVRRKTCNAIQIRV